MHYFFARELRGEAVDVLPSGYRVKESINGVVSLVKDRRTAVSPEEVTIVEEAMRRHFHTRQYRVDLLGDQIVVYEPIGLDADEVAAILSPEDLARVGGRAGLGEALEPHVRYRSVLRFHLGDTKRRLFWAERRSNLVNGEEWIFTGGTGHIEDLARETLPYLLSPGFFRR